MVRPDLTSADSEWESVDQRRLARTRLQFLTSAPVDSGSVRMPILASWRRSRDMRVAAHNVNPVLSVNPELDTELSRAAAPVLNSLFSIVGGQTVSIVLTDRHGLVLTRLTGDTHLEHRLDDVGLAPGFNYAEHSVGTNGIGTALEVGGPTHVFGHEHYAERLEDLACAGVPVRHPVTGRTVGLVDLTCWRRDAGSLLMALATTTARQVQEALLTRTGLQERLLLDEYLRTCRRSTGIVLAVSGTVGMLNDYARTALTPGEQASLLSHAGEALAGGRPRSCDVDLPGGGTARMHAHPVGDPQHPSGLVVRVVRHEQTLPRQRSGSTRTSRPLPGIVGSVPVWAQACREVEQTFLADEWLAVVGQPGVGKSALLQAVQLRRQPVPRLVTFDAADADQPEWVGSVRDALTRAGDSVVLQHADLLPPAPLRSVVGALRDCRDAGPGARPWVALTMGDGEHAPGLQELLRLFPGTVYLPSLRLHAGDIPDLVAHFTRRSSEGGALTWSPEALQVLSRSAWPGNIEQLHHVVRWVIARRRSGVVEPHHLPPETRSVSHRSLNTIESLERDAIVEALQDADGDKEAAALALGMSRATIYRRIRAYGIGGASF